MPQRASVFCNFYIRIDREALVSERALDVGSVAFKAMSTKKNMIKLKSSNVNLRFKPRTETFNITNCRICSFLRFAIFPLTQKKNVDSQTAPTSLLCRAFLSNNFKTSKNK
jgi:hypothetical protein